MGIPCSARQIALGWRENVRPPYFRPCCVQLPCSVEVGQACCVKRLRDITPPYFESVAVFHTAFDVVCSFYHYSPTAALIPNIIAPKQSELFHFLGFCLIRTNCMYLQLCLSCSLKHSESIAEKCQMFPAGWWKKIGKDSSNWTSQELPRTPALGKVISAYFFVRCSSLFAILTKGA